MLAAAALLLVAILGWRRIVHHDAPAAVVGPLRLLSGEEIGALAAEGAAAHTFTLSDGSEVRLEHEARLELLENGGTTFSTLLLQGTATFDVRPGGPRRWAIECGLVTVEVVGTRFTIEKGATRVRVAVERGIVLVRGERVPERVQRLTAGEAIEIEAAQGGLVPPVASTAIASATPGAGTTSTAIAAVPPSPSEVWRPLAKSGRHDQAYALLGPSGIARAAETAPVDDLLALADVARLSGHPRDAVGPLSRIVDQHASSPEAPLAAFTLGRLKLDTLGDAAGAARAFSRAIALGVPNGLEEDAYARLVEARARAGDRAGAKAAAAEYEQRFPNGRRRDALRKWTGAD
jgi:transmembrane sensor